MKSTRRELEKVLTALLLALSAAHATAAAADAVAEDSARSESVVQPLSPEA